jgi:hypothetical protein
MCCFVQPWCSPHNDSACRLHERSRRMCCLGQTWCIPHARTACLLIRKTLSSGDAIGGVAYRILCAGLMITGLASSSFLPYVIHPILGIRASPHFTNDFMIV